MNTPTRKPIMTRDVRVRQTIFSVRAVSQRNYNLIHPFPAAPATVNLDQPKETPADVNRLKDYMMLVII